MLRRRGWRSFKAIFESLIYIFERCILKNWNISHFPPAGFFIRGEVRAHPIFLGSSQITLVNWLLLLCTTCEKKPFLGVPPCPSPPYLQPAVGLLSVKGEPRQNVNAEKGHVSAGLWVHMMEGRPGPLWLCSLH